MSSSYQASKTHVKFPVSKGKPSDRVLKTGKAPHFVPGKANQPFSTQGGTKK